MIKFQTDITLSSIQYTGKTIGRASDGCITVYAPDVNPADTWSKIYNQIVSCRVEGMPGIIGKVNVKNEIK